MDNSNDNLKFTINEMPDYLKTSNIELNKTYTNDDVRFIIKHLSTLDNFKTKENEIKKIDSNDKIKFILDINNKSYDLNLDFGKNKFSNDINKLIANTNKKENTNSINPVENKIADNANIRYVKPTTDKLISGAINSVSSFSGLSEETDKMIENFSKSFNAINNTLNYNKKKVDSNEIKFEKLFKKLDQKINQIIENRKNKKSKSKSITKEITKNKQQILSSNILKI